MATVTKDTIIGDILDMDRTTAPFFPGDGNALLRLPGFQGRIFGTGLPGA